MAVPGQPVIAVKPFAVGTAAADGLAPYLDHPEPAWDQLAAQATVGDARIVPAAGDPDPAHDASSRRRRVAAPCYYDNAILTPRGFRREPPAANVCYDRLDRALTRGTEPATSGCRVGHDVARAEHDVGKLGR